jgi:hypothetical protein
MRTVLFFLLTLYILSSCTTAEFIQHTPTLANTGQHTDKGQFTGRALYSTGSSTSNSVDNDQGPSPYESVNGFQAQGSYAVSKSLAIQSSFMHSGEKGGSEDGGTKTIVYNYDRNITEAGLAYFSPISKNKDLFVELGAGTGFGSYKATENASVLVPGGRFYNHNVLKVYLQPSIYYVSKNVQVSGGFKFSIIRFNDIVSDYSPAERETRALPANNNLSTNTLDFFAKADFFTNKLPWLGLHVQLLTSTDLKKQFNTNQNDNNMGLGLCFKFGEMLQQEKK